MKSIILAGALCATAMPALAGGLYLDAGLLDGGPGRDEKPLITLDTVHGLNAAAGDLALRYSERRNMAEAEPHERGLYLMSAGALAFAFQRANAIIIGHEGAHFHTAGLHGRTEHRFMTSGGDTVSWLNAYGKALLTGHADAIAASGGAANTPTERIVANNAGLNWQSDYAERMLRRGFAGQDLSVFSAADYLLNANYWLLYSAKDKRKDRPFNQGGDPQDLAEYLEVQHGIEGALDDMVKWSALSFLLSSANWQAFSSLNGYVQNAETGLFDGKLTWSVLNYGYEDSFSVAPMVHLRAGDGQGSWIGGVETSVIGDSWTEVQLGAVRHYEKTSFEGIVTFGKDGALLEFGADYQVTDRLAVVGRATVALDGETRRGGRLAPDGDDVFQIGLAYRF